LSRLIDCFDGDDGLNKQIDTKRELDRHYIVLESGRNLQGRTGYVLVTPREPLRVTGII
jgi:hypothetical protein